MYIGIDFGTSNSAASYLLEDTVLLVPLEHGATTIPTAIFFDAEEHRTRFGRIAVSEYTDGVEGRLMRSIKSILGSSLMDETTFVSGKELTFREILALFLGHIREVSQTHLSCEIDRAVLGRPVHFVDDNPSRDAAAEAALAKAAQEAGFKEVLFQLEPIAAAFDYEAGLVRDETVLIVDIGGGTSDFSVLTLGPGKRDRSDRQSDILARSGIHIGGTDFDHRLSMKSAMRCLGLGSPGNTLAGIPSSIYFDLATWHKINFMYSMKALCAARDLRTFFKEPHYHDRLLKVLDGRLGHRIASQVEAAKIEVANGGAAQIDLGFIESNLDCEVAERDLIDAISDDVGKIIASARESVMLAGLDGRDIDTVYFTGGSTGIRLLRERFGSEFPYAKLISGDRFGSVARGLGVYASRVFA